ncbi:MAG: hypothetical protein IE927_15945 [Rhodobacterales bacterium]|nr:hypothetical protein [Rhodobacterales bacterium]
MTGGLLVLHLVLLALGAASQVAQPLIARRAPRAGAEGRAELMALAGQLGQVTRWALAGLIVTGLAMAWAGGHLAAPGPWFLVKIALVGALALVAWGRGLPPLARLGAPRLALLARGLLLAILAVTVLAFR